MAPLPPRSAASPPSTIYSACAIRWPLKLTVWSPPIGVGVWKSRWPLLAPGAAGQVELPELELEDAPDFRERGVMLDVSRDKVPALRTLRMLIDRLARWKVNQLQLYMEHTFAYRDHQVVWADADPMTAEEVRAIDAFCRERHLELVPNQNCLGHMERWLRHDRYRPLAIAPDGFIDIRGRHHEPTTVQPAAPASLALFDSLLQELLPNFTSRRFNVGLDEPWELTADRIDYWIRRRVIACPLGSAGDAARPASAQTAAPHPALPRASTQPRPSRVERPLRSQPALACERRAWLSALGRALKTEYDALVGPMPSRLAALVKQLEAQP